MTQLSRLAAVLPIALVAAGAVAAVALRARALSPAGAVAATAVGAATLVGMGLRGGMALVAFFASSTLLGRLPAPLTRRQRRGNARDAVQVFANGGPAALLAFLGAMAPIASGALRAGFGGALATAAADTWATEIGTRLGGQPRSIATLRPVPPGASGGVTPAGLVASAAGAALIAIILDPPGAGSLAVARRQRLAVAAGGGVGALADSILGATLQEVRICDVCGQETELLVHDCGARTRHLRGFSWCGNDTVNALATATGALVAMAIAARPARQSKVT